MLNRILPEVIDNQYHGYQIALWLFVLIVCLRTGIGLLHVLSSDGGAQSISTIPLDTYTRGAAQNVIALFARLGIAQLMLSVVFVLVLIRYGALIPLMYALMIVSDVALKAIAYAKPLDLAGTSGARTSGLVITALTIVGFVLSLLGSGHEESVRGAP